MMTADEAKQMRIQCVWCGGRIVLPRYDQELMRKEREAARKQGYDEGYAQGKEDALAWQERGFK